MKWTSIKEFPPMQNIDLLLFPDFSGEPVVGFSSTGVFRDGDGRKIQPTHWCQIPDTEDIEGEYNDP